MLYYLAGLWRRGMKTRLDMGKLLCSHFTSKYIKNLSKLTVRQKTSHVNLPILDMVQECSLVLQSQVQLVQERQTSLWAPQES